MSTFDVTLILASFGGGIFAAALGAIGAFSFCGVLILAGVGVAVSGGSVSILNLIAFGPFFGPHIAFAAAVAATSYAGKKGYASGTDIVMPLFKTKKYDVLLVGGIFGIIGYMINTLLVKTGILTDTVALTVFISNIIARIAFGKTGFFGQFKNSKIISTQNIAFNCILGLGVGLISSYATQVTGSVVIGFGISAFTLIFLFNTEFPVTHHVALPAAYAFLATGSLLIGGLFGVLGILCGEIIANIFNTNSDTYIDFPATTIAILSTIIFIVF